MGKGRESRRVVSHGVSRRVAASDTSKKQAYHRDAIYSPLPSSLGTRYIRQRRPTTSGCAMLEDGLSCDFWNNISTKLLLTAAISRSRKRKFFSASREAERPSARAGIATRGARQMEYGMGGVQPSFQLSQAPLPMRSCNPTCSVEQPGAGTSPNTGAAAPPASISSACATGEEISLKRLPYSTVSSQRPAAGAGGTRDRGKGNSSMAVFGLRLPSFAALAVHCSVAPVWIAFASNGPSASRGRRASATAA
eukprot:scaffold7282_cov113-Isochrysis_galbana.AAC.3